MKTRDCTLQVYAMGVVVLQVLTGSPPMQSHDGLPVMHLSDYCHLKRDNILSEADSAAEWTEDVARKMCDLGLRCTDTSREAAQRRPSVGDNIEILESLSAVQTLLWQTTACMCIVLLAPLPLCALRCICAVPAIFGMHLHPDAS